MQEEIDSLQAELQEAVLAEARKIYSKTVIDYAMNPRNVGEISGADGHGLIAGSCGDTMEIWLRVRGGNIEEARFWTDGCSTSIASGGMVTDMAKGKSILEARKISQQDVLKALDGLPPDSEHCAKLAADTLKEAIKDYMIMQKDSWKKTYRKS